MSGAGSRSGGPDDRAGRSRRLSLLAGLAAPAGLCALCRHLELVESQRAAFARCGKARRDETLPRYPRLPVLLCRAFERDE